MAIHAESNSFPVQSALKDRFYLIPDYQRPYRWTDEEVSQLWEDLVKAFEDRENDPSYFLGSIVIIKPSAGNFRFEVIDGQQRLTTLSLLFLVLRERFDKNSELITYLWGKENSFSEEQHLRLETKVYKNQEEWQAMLPAVIEPSGALSEKLKQGKTYNDLTASERKTQEKENLYLLNALLLRDKILEFENIYGRSALQEFVVFIEKNTELIIITCDSQTSALRIFQTLNNRGMDLSVSDLVKADCLRKLTNKLDLREQFINQWNELIHTIETNSDSSWNFEKLLLAYMQLRRFTEIKKPAQIMGSDIELRKYMLDEELADDKVDVIQIVSSLTKIQEAYDDIMINPIDKDTDNYIKLLSLLRTEYWLYPLLQIKRKNGYTKIDFKTLAKFLVKLSYRILIRRKPANEYLRPACRRIITELYKKTSVDEIIAKESKESAEFFDNKKLKSDFFNIRQNMLKPLVHLHASKNAHINLLDKWEVEHILPQKWKEGYLWNQNDAKEYMNSLGNLILIEQSINRIVKNKMYIDKKEIYKEKSKLELVTSLPIQHSEWTVDDCKTREKKVIEDIIKLL